MRRWKGSILIDRWIEDKALVLVGGAAVLSQMQQWKMLEKNIADALREAYEKDRD